MVSTVYSAAVYGIDSKVIRVEADVSDGLPSFEMVGDLSTQVKEAQNRVKTALKNSNLSLKPQKITVNLSPADLKKTGTGFDLPIAVAVLVASGMAFAEYIRQTLIIGELSLNGMIRPVKGVLAMVADAKKNNFSTCIVPRENLNEAKLIKGIRIIPVASLCELVDYLDTGESIENDKDEEVHTDGAPGKKQMDDFSDIVGQEMAKKAAMIAAAGFHNMLMVGPPGTGKSMLAKRIPGILPQLSQEEQIEVSKIYSVLGLLDQQKGLINVRPFRSPHHTITAKGLTGGGLVPKPGELSLAHQGILFLDELPEYGRDCIESLRQPMENHFIRIFRNGEDYHFPAKIMLVAAMNPCPCGYFPAHKRCKCSSSMIQKYLGKISFPILDRIDLCVELQEVKPQTVFDGGSNHYTSAFMKEKVAIAREVQKERFAGTGIHYNSEISPKELAKYCSVNGEIQHLLDLAYEEMQLSMRALHKLIRLSRTIADLDESVEIKESHVAQAFAYRNIRTTYW